MFALSSVTFDPLGDVQTNNTSGDDLDMKRRLSRTATLNGGTKLYDGGYSDGDTALQLLFPYSTAASSALKNLIINHSQILMTSRHGCFSGAIEALRFDDRLGNFVVRFLVVERVI